MPLDTPRIRKFEFEEQIGDKCKNLLPSQREFIFAPERYSAISGGFGSGALGSGQVGWAHISSGAIRSG